MKWWTSNHFKQSNIEGMWRMFKSAMTTRIWSPGSKVHDTGHAQSELESMVTETADIIAHAQSLKCQCHLHRSKVNVQIRKNTWNWNKQNEHIYMHLTNLSCPDHEWNTHWIYTLSSNSLSIGTRTRIQFEHSKVQVYVAFQWRVDPGVVGTSVELRF